MATHPLQCKDPRPPRASTEAAPPRTMPEVSSANLSARACRACCDGVAQRARRQRLGRWAVGGRPEARRARRRDRHDDWEVAAVSTTPLPAPRRGSLPLASLGCWKLFCYGLTPQSAICKCPFLIEISNICSLGSGLKFVVSLRNRIRLLWKQKFPFAIEIDCDAVDRSVTAVRTGWQPEPCGHAFTRP